MLIAETELALYSKIPTAIPVGKTLMADEELLL
jgi:hypothetical protein